MPRKTQEEVEIVYFPQDNSSPDALPNTFSQGYMRENRKLFLPRLEIYGNVIKMIHVIDDNTTISDEHIRFINNFAKNNPNHLIEFKWFGKQDTNLYSLRSPIEPSVYQQQIVTDTFSRLDDVKNLALNDYRFYNFDFLYLMPQLETLTIRLDIVSYANDFQPVFFLKNLRKLSIHTNNSSVVYSLKGLENLTNLQSLKLTGSFKRNTLAPTSPYLNDLQFNPTWLNISKVKHADKWQQLIFDNISLATSDDLDFLQICPNITRLTFNCVRNKHQQVFKALNYLQSLDILEFNTCTDIQCLDFLGEQLSITTLNLINLSGLESVYGIHRLKNLKYLTIYFRNKRGDLNLSSFFCLPKLVKIKVTVCKSVNNMLRYYLLGFFQELHSANYDVVLYTEHYNGKKHYQFN